jgi:hypothetical protein
MLSRKPSTGCLQIPAQIAQIRIAEDDTLKPKPTDHIGGSLRECAKTRVCSP